MTEFYGKHIVITGGSSGIGFEVTQRCLRNGALKVAVLDIHDRNNAVAKLQEEFPEKEVIFLQTDVADNANVKRSFKVVKAKFERINIAIGNAGIGDESNPQRTVQVNLIGIINSTLAAIDCMSKTHGGQGGIILNVASMAGLNSYPGFPAYNASKHGVVGYTQSFNHEYYSNAYGIKFLTGCPGLTLTAFYEAMVKFDFDAEAEKEYVSRVRLQTVDQAADAILQILQKAKHGTIWKIEGGDLEEVSIKQYWKPI